VSLPERAGGGGRGQKEPAPPPQWGLKTAEWRTMAGQQATGVLDVAALGGSNPVSHHHHHTTLVEGLVLWQLGKIARSLEEKKPQRHPTPAELGLGSRFTPEQQKKLQAIQARDEAWNRRFAACDRVLAALHGRAIGIAFLVACPVIAVFALVKQFLQFGF
jgi:hypothetical protein